MAEKKKKNSLSKELALDCSLSLHRKTSIDLLYHLVTHKSKGLGGIHPRVLNKLAEVLTNALPIFVLVNWGGASGLQFGQCDAHL